MIYECDNCQTPLPPNEMRCPKCGEAFDEQVPADAELPKRGFTAVSEVPRDAPNDFTLQDTPANVSSGILPTAAISGQNAPSTSPWNQPFSGTKLLAIIIFVVLGFVVFGKVFNNDNSISPVATVPAPVVSPPSTSVPNVSTDSDVNNSGPSTPDDTPQLEKGSEHFSKESDYDIVSGEITNVGSNKLDNVEATTTFYDSDGNVVKTSDAIIDFNPLMPGQTSPYKTMDTDNPLIKTEKTEFHSMGGPLIPYSLKSGSRRVGNSDAATGGDTGTPGSTRDPVSEVATPGSGLSDQPLKRNVLQNTILTDGDLAGKSLASLSISYNTIYAVHGYIFKRRSLQRTFDQMSWYHPNPAFSETDLSATERSNLKTIRDFERKEFHY